MRFAPMPAEMSASHSEAAGYSLVRVGNYFGHNKDRRGAGPQVFVVEMVEPLSTLQAHFHSVNQFQLVIDGGGTMGRRAPLQPAVIHYADAYTPYGPIRAGEQGLTYLTLRARHDGGAHFMPGSGHLRRRRNLRARISSTDVPTGPVTLIEPEPDGLGVERLIVSGGVAFDLVCGASNESLLAYVWAGSLVVDDTTHPTASCVHLEQHDTLRANVGPEGLDLIVARFPICDWQYDASNPLVLDGKSR